jgi:hypothetical protein
MASALEQYKEAVREKTIFKWNAQFAPTYDNQRAMELEDRIHTAFKAAHAELSQTMNGVTVDTTLIRAHESARESTWGELRRNYELAQTKEVARQTFLKQGGDPEKFDGFWEQAWNERQAEAVKTGIDDPLNIKF